MDSNVSTDTRPSAAFKGEMLQIAGENHCQNRLQAAPACSPSGIHLRCRDETLEKTLAKRGLRQHLPATTWQVSPSTSSNSPMSPKGHPMTLFPRPGCLSLPICKKDSECNPSNSPQRGPGQGWHSTTTMGKHLPSGETFPTSLMDMVWPGDTWEQCS